MLFEVLLAALLVMLVSLTGIIFIQKTAEQFLKNNLSFLVSFSAGVFLVTALGLGLEVFETISSVYMGVGLIVFGYIVAWCLHAFMPETHHHHDEKCARSSAAARKLIIGDAVHNVADGVVMVVAFAASPALGLAATTSIVIHEALQEVSEFFVLRQAGYSIRKALTINFAVSGTILIGVVLGYFALITHEIEVVLLAISAGFFLHVVFNDLLPKPSEHESIKQFFKHLTLVILGVVLMGAIASFLNDSHAHSEEQDNFLEEAH